MNTRHAIRFLTMLAISSATALAAERTQHFDSDPNWDGRNNHARSPEPRTIEQNFGFSAITSHCGGAPGEMGGFINPAAEPAYYAKALPTLSFNDVLSASGKVVCATGPFHVLVGFFNSKSINEWRTPNTIAIRLQGRGDYFYAYVEYTSSKWRAGGDSPGGFSVIRDAASGRTRLKGFTSGNMIHTWSLRYDPQGNRGTGSIHVTIDGEVSICHLDPGHKADGATFNRFGLLNVMKQWDSGGEVWLDDISVNGEEESFDRDPGWEGFQNHHKYVSKDVRPRFDFGYSPTHFAGGKAAGEMGGLIFRGDGRYTNMMAFYGDRLAELTIKNGLKASGKISLRRAVSDSDVLFGFFHAQHSLDSGGTDRISTPPDFIGITIGGPSREGFQVSPAYRLHNNEQRHADGGPYIYPDGASHDFIFEYAPAADGKGNGVIKVTLDGQPVTLDVPVEHQAAGAHYNRFGLISTHTDGNVQHLYFDDLTYTFRQ